VAGLVAINVEAHCADLIASKIGNTVVPEKLMGRCAVSPLCGIREASFPRKMSLEELCNRRRCRDGAAFKSTPAFWRELRGHVAVAHNEPNGMNINDGCGSTHPDEIQRIVKLADADVGITHDGDADRVLLCGRKWRDR